MGEVCQGSEELLSATRWGLSEMQGSQELGALRGGGCSMGSRDQPMGDSAEETEEVCQEPGGLASATHWHLWRLQEYPWGSQRSAPQLRGDPDEDTGEVCQGLGIPAGLPSA